jgi:hypothetical protein
MCRHRWGLVLRFLEIYFFSESGCPGPCNLCPLEVCALGAPLRAVLASLVTAECSVTAVVGIQLKAHVLRTTSTCSTSTILLHTHTKALHTHTDASLSNATLLQKYEYSTTVVVVYYYSNISTTVVRVYYYSSSTTSTPLEIRNASVHRSQNTDRPGPTATTVGLKHDGVSL